ncbi:VOC family protein [Zobellia galactanivorans]|uniref:VOC family protein n=1 Tax=Zobellia galactanivorans (strain DSM 12802 / CCUG 47099 / CIP 106680 / NCIMB 13871 / Dsij) TaxID=63186 RepID=UPI001C06B77E|nr:VOC family protein [Zobellia galactanivorans]MBU3028393.1 VOC family protein [Zobellia galactanivorans]
MATVNTYLYFNGNCEKAFNFYKSVFNKKFKFIGRYKDVPEVVRPSFPHCEDQHIMHIGLPISKETMLMGADLIDLSEKENNTAKHFSLFVHTNSREEADRLFSSLAQEGGIKLPISEQFWGSYYGICLDKFGVNWKISFSQAPD